MVAAALGQALIFVSVRSGLELESLKTRNSEAETVRRAADAVKDRCARSSVCVVTVTIRPMRDDEFGDWLPKARSGYAIEMVQNGGVSPDAARAKAAADTRRTFPGGRPSPDQSVFVIEADGAPVGELWLAERRGDLEGDNLWVFNLRIDEVQRGRGYGRAAMLLAEDEARRRGLSRVALNVFGGNRTARNLYQSLGYEENAITMIKTLAPTD
jgi:GNAT superfamily N-acetyltransferase